MEMPTLVFVPGFMQRGEAWRPVADRLGERYPSVLLDHATWTRAERIEEICAAAPPGSVPVGYSMGGRLVLHAAVRDPARWPAIALVGVSAGPADPEARAERDRELADWMERHPIEDGVRRWEQNPVFATQSPDLVEAQRPGRLSHDPACLARLLRSAGQGAMEPIWDDLPRLEIPVICIAGELDPTYVAAGRRMASLLPHGTLRIVSGVGHAPQLEWPDAVAAELRRFLA